MILRDLLHRSGYDEASPPTAASIVIKDICHDSRKAAAGSLFVAVAGTVADGAAYVDQAVQRGAVAIVADRDIATPKGICLVRVRHCRAAITRLAAAFYGLDKIQSRGELKAIGITGTNGKTTTAFMLRSIIEAAGQPVALWGTIEYDLRSRKIGGNLTTPDPIDLVRQMVEAHAAGARYAVMEVSSHSLDQHRTDGIRYTAAIFTNLTQDHLDYHQTQDRYLQAKQRLFTGLSPEAAAIVNADDPAGVQIVQDCDARLFRYGLHPGGGKTLSQPCGTEPYGTGVSPVVHHRPEACATGCFGIGSKIPEQPSIDRPDAEGPMLRAMIGGEDKNGCRFTITHGDRRIEIKTSLVGRYNVSNALAAAAAGRILGFDWDTIQHGLEKLGCIPGRLQRIETGPLGFSVFVDYAHTDDALRNVLQTLRPLTTSRLWCVFGCGGDRDRSKRAKMAQAVARDADAFVITSDNPRTEDPMAIIADIQKGLSKGDLKRSLTESDRAKAIALAVERLLPGDTLVIAGKGHENYQILRSGKIHFDDVEVVESAIQQRIVTATNGRSVHGNTE